MANNHQQEQYGDIVEKQHQISEASGMPSQRGRAEQLQGIHSEDSVDAVVSWGRSGATETTPEHGAPSIPESAAVGAGIFPEKFATTSTTPNDFGHPVVPVADHSKLGGPGGGACNSMEDILRRG
jgi:hypothetical protein